MRPTPAFVNLLDDAAFLSLEHQLHLADVLGEHSWQVNLQTRSFTFDTERGSVECTDFHFLGTAAPGPSSWLWSWANRSGFPESVAALAASVRKFGVEHEISELSVPELPFDTLPFDQPEPYQVAAVLTEAAKAVTAHWTGYQGPAGDDGTRAAFLVDHPDFRLPPAEGARIMRTLTEGLSGLALYDQRRALNSYLALRGLNPVFSADESQLIVDSPVLAGTIGFDEHGVAASLELTRPGSR
ncbi:MULTISPECIES: DUF6882 domain-containing protein [Nocardia]|uniref:DUF6882 domain-containing protein n=1 Tax=Nocardia TaxID=1817 RepID=UPI001E3891AE|nr:MULTISPECIES: DUF6882 domain-containing protein [Nocardia]